MVHRKRASSYHPMQMPPLPHLALLLSKLAKPTTLSSSRIKLEIICVHSLPQRRVNHDDANLRDSISIQDPPTSLISILEPDPTLKQRRSVHFNHEVSVVPIPSRTSYTPYTQSRLFIGKKEMIRNARRNERVLTYEHQR